VLQLAFTYAPLLQRIFGSTGLTATEWARVLAAGVFVFSLAEVEKSVQRKLRQRRRPAAGWHAALAGDMKSLEQRASS
jgi:hypothetical protein